MENKYFIAIVKEKYDCWPQDIGFIGMYDCFYLALEQVKNHNKTNYNPGLREFNYFIFISDINDKVVMEEKDCIYSLTSGMREEYEEYVKEDYNQYLHLKK